MEMNRRALYNSLRMNWVLDPSFEVEAWQVEDYRAMPIDLIFEKLENHKIFLDKTSFLAFADSVETPEELTDALLADTTVDSEGYDQCYLLVFELWRRLLPEKPCLSIFCDEMDHQIHLYDRGEQNAEAIQDALANLQVLLDENADSGVDPHEAFEYINTGCANDLEEFLYDFISEKIDDGNDSYAIDLLEGFGAYVQDVKWFELLRARLIAKDEPEEANHIVEQLLEDKRINPDIEFYLEVLSFLVSSGDKKTFEGLVTQIADLIQVEEDFQSLVSICADFYHRLDRENLENALQELLDKRSKVSLDRSFDRKDPQFAEFFKILSMQ